MRLGVNVGALLGGLIIDDLLHRLGLVAVLHQRAERRVEHDARFGLRLRRVLRLRRLRIVRRTCRKTDAQGGQRQNEKCARHGSSPVAAWVQATVPQSRARRTPAQAWVKLDATKPESPA